MADYYTPTGWPGQNAAASSAALRSEFVSIGEGFGKLPDPTTPNLPVVTNGIGMETKSVELFKALMGLPREIFSVSATVNANALAVNLSPTTIAFRSATLSSGESTEIPVPSALALVVPSGATLGTQNVVESTLAIIAINNGGTVELAIANIDNMALNESALIDTVAISTGSDSGSAIYSVTSREDVPFRVVGIVKLTQITAGTWSNGPSIVQGAGGGRFLFGNAPALNSPTIKGTRERKAVATAGVIDLAAGNYFTASVSGALALSVANVPASSVAIAFILELTNGGAFAITWWSGIRWENGAVPTFTHTGVDILTFYTHDGGTTWNAIFVGRDMQ